MTVRMPYQLFINGEFVDSSNGRTFDCINPTDGSVRNKFKWNHRIRLVNALVFLLIYFLLVF